MGSFDKIKSGLVYWDSDFNLIVKGNPYTKYRQTVASKFQGGKTLEVGCGIFPISDNSTLVEISDNALKYLAEKGRAPLRCDVRNLCFKADYFDTVFMLDVLEHLNDYKVALREIFRVLKPEGRLVLSVPIHEKKRNVLDEMWGHFHRFEPEKLTQDLEELGFSVSFRKVLFGPSFTIWKKIASSLIRVFGPDIHKGCSNLSPISPIIYLLVSPLYPILYLESKATPVGLAEGILLVAQK